MLACTNIAWWAIVKMHQWIGLVKNVILAGGSVFIDLKMSILRDSRYMPLQRFVRVLCNQRNIVNFLVGIVLTGKRRYRPGKRDIYLLKTLGCHQESRNMISTDKYCLLMS